MPGRKRPAKVREFTAIFNREGELWVALCPELDVASQGATVDEAEANLREAVEGFLEAADAKEIAHRLAHPVVVRTFEAPVG
jgi:predicted RNase H-like HicB family nuclease